jgi:hypothetical protein
MFDRQNQLAQTVISGVDLAIDFATLGEYGLEPTGHEPTAADGPCGARPGAERRSPGNRLRGEALAAGWEALFPTKARRGACRAPRPALAR